MTFKARLVRLLLVASGFAVAACSNHAPTVTTGSVPRAVPTLHFSAADFPEEKNQPIRISFSVANQGEETLSLSHEQFKLTLSTPEQPQVFWGPLVFPPDTPRVLVIQPGEVRSLTATCLRNRQGTQLWSELVPGISSAQIYINSRKDSAFPGQWLGQTYSEVYEVSRARGVSE